MKFLTETRGNFFIFGSYWVGQGVIFLFMIFFLAETRGKFLVIKVSCETRRNILILGGYWLGQEVVFLLEG